MDHSAQYRRTDLALEALPTPESLPQGITVTEKKRGALLISTVSITSEEGEKTVGKPMGSYVTVSFPDFWENGNAKIEKAVTLALTERLLALLPSPAPRRLLVIGLGNRGITADALGPFVQEKLTVTGHLPEETTDTPHCKLFAFAPSVMGKTGIETLALAQGAVSACKPDAVLVIDALVAAGVERLGRTVQLADTGLIPGSGIGNHRAALNQDSLGVPVIAIGVPLVVSSATLVYDALMAAGIDTPSEALTTVLENGKSFFVTPKSCDLASEVLSKVIANAINQAFS